MNVEIIKEAKEHSAANNTVTWILAKEDTGDTFYTDSEECFARAINDNYKCEAEFCDGTRTF